MMSPCRIPTFCVILLKGHIQLQLFIYSTITNNTDDFNQELTVCCGALDTVQKLLIQSVTQFSTRIQCQTLFRFSIL